MSEEREPGSLDFGGGLTGGPAPGQFLIAFQALVRAINNENAALTALLNRVLAMTAPQLALTETAPPAAPASGAIIYVSNVDHHTYVVNSSGTRTQIAP
jgi:hypothetical protein